MNTRIGATAVMTLAFGFLAAGRALGDEVPGPFYEKDGWLDVTEWFDGNDYNPTDEVWWRWDDETYNPRQASGTDVDNDSWYGYSTPRTQDWFYDYYDPNVYYFYDLDRDGLYNYGYRYYDYDNDGLADAYVSYSDWNGDGLYDDIDFFTFSDKGTAKQKQSAPNVVSRESKQQSLTGEIQKTKSVKVRNGKKHTVVAIQQPDAKDKMLMADLGDESALKDLNLKVGDKITVKGPRAQVGEQRIILANSIDINGKNRQIDRSPRTITGKVVDTHKTKIRGQEHQMAMVETTQKGKTQKVAVDLGRADQLKQPINKGSSITFSAFPVKVQNKLLMVAQSVEQDGRLAQINRQPLKADDSTQATGRSQD